MNGNRDGRPEPAQRASDPSLEEMLRRARAARLGDETGYDRPASPAHLPPPGDWHDRRLWGWLLFVAGVLAGVLVSICVASVAATVSSWSAPVALSTPPATATAIPATPTSTPTPLPTVTPTATAVALAPPTTDEIVTLAQAFYDNQAPIVISTACHGLVTLA